MTKLEDGIVNYESNAGRHIHELCNHCTWCGEPMLATYCKEHTPTWFYTKRSHIWTKIKLFFTGTEELL